MPRDRLRKRDIRYLWTFPRKLWCPDGTRSEVVRLRRVLKRLTRAAYTMYDRMDYSMLDPTVLDECWNAITEAQRKLMKFPEKKKSFPVFTISRRRARLKRGRIKV